MSKVSKCTNIIKNQIPIGTVALILSGKFKGNFGIILYEKNNREDYNLMIHKNPKKLYFTSINKIYLICTKIRIFLSLSIEKLYKNFKIYNVIKLNKLSKKIKKKILTHKIILNSHKIKKILETLEFFSQRYLFLSIAHKKLNEWIFNKSYNIFHKYVNTGFKKTRNSNII